jgi:hypothetical protein
MSRIIGLTHRVKKTAEGEARPTLVLIRESGKTDRALKLEEEADEYDFFVLGRFPIGYRDVVPGEDLSQFLARQLQTRKNKETREEEVTKVPIVFDGLRPGDTVAMPLGGSGDYLAYAIARKALALGEGTCLLRLKPVVLKAKRGDEAKDKDHLLLANLAERESLLFQPVEVKDLNLIRLRVAFRALTDTMKARIACEQRLYQLVIGQVFVQAGDCPEGDIKKAYDKLKTTDPGLQALIQHEETCEREMKAVLLEIPVYRKVFEPIKGVGPRIAARLISSIGDVRLFETAAKLKAFCGVHVMPDGCFVRRRAGQVANWHPDARQALYLLADQFNRRPDSEWGQKLREYKIKFRETHPNVETNGDGKKKYTDGHIHKMALWRTVTKFTERLWKDWMALESAA